MVVVSAVNCIRKAILLLYDIHYHNTGWPVKEFPSFVLIVNRTLVRKNKSRNYGQFVSLTGKYFEATVV